MRARARKKDNQNAMIRVLLLLLVTLVVVYIVHEGIEWQKRELDTERLAKRGIVALHGGKKSKSVRLLPDGTVEKRYDRHSSRSIRNMNIELYFLKQLETCPFVPKLLSVNRDKARFTMTYCGPPVHGTPEDEQEIDHLLHRLEREWGIVRSHNVGMKRYGLGNFGNATRLNGKLFLIDFGSTSWIDHKKKGVRRIHSRMRRAV